MRISCPSCGRTVPTDEVNVQALVAKCTPCGEVFPFAAQVGDDAKKAPVQMPKGFSLAQEMSDLLITRRWFSPAIIALVVFCCIWDGFMAFAFFGMYQQAGGFSSQMLFLSLHTAVGIGITYATLAGFLNSTTIRINNQVVSVRHAPLPWPGQRDLPVGQIDQLFCTKEIRHGRHGTSTVYHVKVTTRAGKTLALISSLNGPNDARFIEQQVEGRLGIADRVMDGELDLRD